MRISRSHGFPSELILSHPPQTMPKQCRAHFEWNAEILKPRREGMAEIMEVEINDLRLGH